MLENIEFNDQHSPFNLNNQSTYEKWRDEKLNHYPVKAEQLVVELNDPSKLTQAEHKAIVRCCKKTNMAVYVSKSGTNPDKRIATGLAHQFSLNALDKNMGADDDGITSLQVSTTQGRDRYIPYTNKAIHWHTDGYYNKLDQQIYALNLHCVRPAKNGGENALMDHEIAYIKLREINPDFIHALMQPDAMIIPANVKDGVTIRPDRTGPVFSVRGDNFLHMRYTARAHNVLWKNNSITQAAVRALDELLHSDNEYVYRLTLQSGWGLISNNVLHDRSGFEDDNESSRLLYRLRYFDRLNLQAN
jgi:TfdA family taurine catabolism dioxygenase TauD